MVKHLIEKYPIFFVAMLALSVRLVLFLFIQVPDQSGGDFYFYEHLAKSLLQGKGFDGELNVAPGWPFFLMVLYFITGTSNMAVLLIGHTILGVLIAVSTYMLAKQLFSDRVAILAGAIMAIWPIALISMFHFGNGLLLYTLLLSFSVITFLQSWDSGNMVFAGMSGFLLALAALTDPIALYIPVAFGLWCLFVVWRDKINNRLSFKARKAIIFFIFLFMFVLSLFPWSYRNFVVFDGMDNAPFISKQIERDFIDKKRFSRILQVFSISEFPQLVFRVQQMFLVPYRINTIDLNTKIKYKQVATGLFSGKYVKLSYMEVFIFISKIVLSVIHWFLVLFAVYGVVLMRYRNSTMLFLFILGYVAFSAIGYGSLSYYKGISPLNEFFFPFLPFVVSFASYAVINCFLPRYTKARPSKGKIFNEGN